MIISQFFCCRPLKHESQKPAFCGSPTFCGSRRVYVTLGIMLFTAGTELHATGAMLHTVGAELHATVAKLHATGAYFLQQMHSCKLQVQMQVCII